MNEIEKLINWARNFINGNERKLISITVPIIFSVFTYKHLKNIIVIRLTFFNLKVDIVYVLIAFFFILWFIFLNYSKSKLKNKTNLPGVGLFIEESLVSKENKSKKLFFAKLKRELSNEFHFSIFELSDFKKYMDNQVLTPQIFKDYNLRFAILIVEESANENDKEVYQIENCNIGFYAEDIMLEEINTLELYKNIQTEIDNLFQEKYKIRIGNNLVDSEQIATELHIVLSYLAGISYMVTSNPNLSLPYFANVKNMLAFMKHNSPQIEYIKKNINEAEFNCKYNSLVLRSMYNNPHTEDYTLELIEGIDNLIQEFRNTKFHYNEDMLELQKSLIIYKADALFDLKKFDEALDVLNAEKIYEMFPDNYFILATSCMFGSANISNNEALIYFEKNKKIFSRSKTYFIDFVFSRYRVNENDLLIKYLFWLVNKNYKDKVLANKLKHEIRELTKDYDNVLK